ncbi:MAG: AbrB/MazE/SpoVT family DNA-binding domain-containing protein [Chloroflexi bacterium]|nr:AbrB/MazE/SpoVT family DNA-binding domain-containing protein [Chloroflexota bacterium]
MNWRGGWLGRCLGATTIGERGQVVIPIEARKELSLQPGTKLLVFWGSGGSSLFLIKADALTDMVSRTMAHLSELERLAQGERADLPSEEAP